MRPRCPGRSRQRWLRPACARGGAGSRQSGGRAAGGGRESAAAGDEEEEEQPVPFTEGGTDIYYGKVLWSPIPFVSGEAHTTRESGAGEGPPHTHPPPPLTHTHSSSTLDWIVPSEFYPRLDRSVRVPPTPTNLHTLRFHPRLDRIIPSAWVSRKEYGEYKKNFTKCFRDSGGVPPTKHNLTARSQALSGKTGRHRAPLGSPPPEIRRSLYLRGARCPARQPRGR